LRRGTVEHRLRFSMNWAHSYARHRIRVEGAFWRFEDEA
jgi:hypothetical protein